MFCTEYDVIHLFPSQLFSGDETLAANNYLSIDLDLFKPPSMGAIAGIFFCINQ